MAATVVAYDQGGTPACTIEDLHEAVGDEAMMMPAEQVKMQVSSMVLAIMMEAQAEGERRVNAVQSGGEGWPVCDQLISLCNEWLDKDHRQVMEPKPLTETRARTSEQQVSAHCDGCYEYVAACWCNWEAKQCVCVTRNHRSQ